MASKQWARVLPFDRQSQRVCGMHTHDAWLIRDVLARVGADGIRAYLDDLAAHGAGYLGRMERAELAEVHARHARHVQEGWFA